MCSVNALVTNHSYSYSSCAVLGFVQGKKSSDENYDWPLVKWSLATQGAMLNIILKTGTSYLWDALDGGIEPDRHLQPVACVRWWRE